MRRSSGTPTSASARTARAPIRSDRAAPQRTGCSSRTRRRSRGDSCSRAATPGPGPATHAAVPSLSADPEFRRISSASWPDADMTAIAMPDPDGSANKTPIALELTVTAHGVATRLRLPYKRRPPNITWRRSGACCRRIRRWCSAPPTSARWRRPRARRPTARRWSSPKAEGVGLEPPTWLATATPAACSGWYPREGGALGRLARSGELGRQGRRDLAAARDAAPVVGGATAVKDGYRFKLVGPGAGRQQRRRARERGQPSGETEPAPVREEPVKGQFDGDHVAQSLEDRAGRAPTRKPASRCARSRR